jgi:hypothetical protein
MASTAVRSEAQALNSLPTEAFGYRLLPQAARLCHDAATDPIGGPRRALVALPL